MIVFKIDDEHPDPESFIQSALDAKIQSLDAAIASASGDAGELGRLIDVRERYLARRGSASPAAESLQTSEPVKPQEFIPEGAIPQPRRFSTAKKIVEAPKHHAAPSAAAKPPSHMASFLQGIQATSKNQAPQQPAPSTPPSGGGGGMMSFLKNVQSKTPEPSAPEPPAQSPPPPASPAGGGAMLSYLQKMKSGEPAQAPSKEKPKKENEKHGELHNELEGLFDELK